MTEHTIRSSIQHHFFRKSGAGFTLIELLVVMAVIGFLASIIVASLADAQRDARDRKRVEDLKQLEIALNLYHNDNNSYPRESQGSNGLIEPGTTFASILAPYISAVPVDPQTSDDNSFGYYYDGSHFCGSREYAVIFARQMSNPENANYPTFESITCSGNVHGEGRGGGLESYNLIVGLSSD